MVEEKWRDLGSLMGDVAVYTYIYMAILLAVVIVLTVIVISYLQKRKAKKEDSKGAVGSRIFIYIFLGVLALVVSPVVFLMISGL